MGVGWWTVFTKARGQRCVVQELGSQSHTSEISVKMHLSVSLLPLLCPTGLFSPQLVCQRAPETLVSSRMHFQNTHLVGPAVSLH